VRGVVRGIFTMLVMFVVMVTSYHIGTNSESMVEVIENAVIYGSILGLIVVLGTYYL